MTNGRWIAAATHNQALSALLFLYREVLDIDLSWIDGVQRPRTPKHIPSVLAVAEVATVLSALPANMALLARLPYGTGMRLMEGPRQQVLAARASWEQDRQAQHGGVEVPHALEAKYPGVVQRWGWFWVFPASALSVDPRTGI